MSNELVNYGVSDIRTMADAFAKSKLFGIKTVEEGMALCLIAQAEGSHPAIAMRDYQIIQGKPGLKADAMLARFQNAGGKVEWEKYTDESVIGKFSHPAGGTIRIDWDKKRATDAGLWGKDNWRKYSRAMLRARVISEAIRTILPSVNNGFYTPEEVQDFDDTPKQTFNGKTIENELPKTEAEVVAAAFSMQGDVDPANPFKTSEERKAWMIGAKDALENNTEDEETLADWLAQYGGHLKYLGMYQLTAMNNIIDERRAYIANRAMDNAANNAMKGA